MCRTVYGLTHQLIYSITIYALSLLRIYELNPLVHNYKVFPRRPF